MLMHFGDIRLSSKVGLPAMTNRARIFMIIHHTARINDLLMGKKAAKKKQRQNYWFPVSSGGSAVSKVRLKKRRIGALQFPLCYSTTAASVNFTILIWGYVSATRSAGLKSDARAKHSSFLDALFSWFPPFRLRRRTSRFVHCYNIQATTFLLSTGQPDVHFASFLPTSKKRDIWVRMGAN